MGFKPRTHISLEYRLEDCRPLGRLAVQAIVVRTTSTQAAKGRRCRPVDKAGRCSVRIARLSGLPSQNAWGCLSRQPMTGATIGGIAHYRPCGSVGARRIVTGGRRSGFRWASSRRPLGGSPAERRLPCRCWITLRMPWAAVFDKCGASIRACHPRSPVD